MASKDRRAAALAAAEARLRGAPSPAELEDQPKAPKVETWIQPSEKDDLEAKKVFARMIDRGIVRDNGYRQAAEAVETLLKIANNILQNSEEKFRKLKSTNKMLKEKVLNARGGHEYLIAMGFRTQTIDFTLTYVLIPSSRRMHELRLGADVLESHLPSLQARVAGQNISQTSHKSEEAARIARALREIDEDRDLVKARVERERIVREAREKAQREEEERKKKQEAEEEDEEYDEIDMAAGRGLGVANYMAAPRGGDAQRGQGAEEVDNGPRRLGGGPVGDEEMGDGDSEEEDEDEDDDDDDAAPPGQQSYNNGNATQLQAPAQALGGSAPPPLNDQGSANALPPPSTQAHPRHPSQHRSGRGSNSGSSTADRRDIISSSLRRGGPSRQARAFGGSGNRLGGEGAGETAQEEEEGEEDQLLGHEGGDGVAEEDEEMEDGGGRRLGSA